MVTFDIIVNHVEPTFDTFRTELKNFLSLVMEQEGSHQYRIEECLNKLDKIFAADKRLQEVCRHIRKSVDRQRSLMAMRKSIETLDTTCNTLLNQLQKSILWRSISEETGNDARLQTHSLLQNLTRTQAHHLQAFGFRFSGVENSLINKILGHPTPPFPTENIMRNAMLMSRFEIKSSEGLADGEAAQNQMLLDLN